jgi:hypothetical protein
MENNSRVIGESLYRFQSAINENGLSLEDCTKRTLYAIHRVKKINKIDDVTFFGKNPDSHPLYLY